MCKESPGLYLYQAVISLSCGEKGQEYKGLKVLSSEQMYRNKDCRGKGFRTSFRDLFTLVDCKIKTLANFLVFLSWIRE